MDKTKPRSNRISSSTDNNIVLQNYDLKYEKNYNK